MLKQSYNYHILYWGETGNTQIILLGLTYVLNFKVDRCQEFSGKEKIPKTKSDYRSFDVILVSD